MTTAATIWLGNGGQTCIQTDDYACCLDGVADVDQIADNIRSLVAGEVPSRDWDGNDPDARIAEDDEDYRTKERAVDLAQAPVLRRVA